jgi:hypothetical protein
MSSLIPPIGSYLPILQIVIRAAAPIAVDYIVTRLLQAPGAAMVPALGTLVLANRNVTPRERVADSLLYIAYKALHCFFSRAENNSASRGVGYEEIGLKGPLSQVPNLENLQKQFKELLPAITWTAGSSFEKVDPSKICKRWGDPSVITKATALFEMAAKDSTNLYDDLITTLFDFVGTAEQRYKKMAELLMDKNQSYYKRFCDPSKPSIFFLYHFARGYGYYTRVGGTNYAHSTHLENSDIQPFYQHDTPQSNWRSVYNQHVALWKNVLKHLPADSVVCQCAVTDTQQIPQYPVYSQDDFLIG